MRIERHEQEHKGRQNISPSCLSPDEYRYPRRCKSNKTKSTMTTTLPLLILVSVLPHLVLADASVGDAPPPPRQRNREVCPTDPSLFGYTSLLAINDDIQREVQALTFDPTLKPQEKYEFVLCPHTHFNGAEGLEPILNNTVFQCGGGAGDGVASENNCTIRGGTHQVLMRERDFYLPMEYVEFRGITFDSSAKYSIAAFAPPSVTARFQDCHWVHNTGQSSIHITGHVSTKVVVPQRRKLQTDPLDDEEFEPSDEDQSEYDQYLNGEGHPPLAGEGEGEASEPVEPATAPHQPDPILDPQSGGEELEVDDNPDGPIKPAMTVELHNCSISNGFGYNTTSHEGYRGIFNAGGNLLVSGTTMENNHGGIFINIMGNESQTKITDSVLHHNNVTILVRPISQAHVHISKTGFMSNRVSASVALKDAKLDIEECAFLENESLNGEIWSFASEVKLDKLCIQGGSSLQPIFLDEHTEYIVGPIYGAFQQVGSDHCATKRSGEGLLGGVLVEKAGSDCYEGHENCKGHCVDFELGECTLPFFSLPPTPAPKEVVVEASTPSPVSTMPEEPATQQEEEGDDASASNNDFGDFLQPPEDEHDAEKPPTPPSETAGSSTTAPKTSGAATTMLLSTTTTLLFLPFLSVLLG